MAAMSRTKALLFSLLGLALSCSSSDGALSGDALELKPRTDVQCKTYDCGDPPDGHCDEWQGGDGCMLDCPRGGPVGDVAVYFECDEVHVVSCKDLSNVVVEYEDGKHQKFDGLDGHYGTFGAGDRVIVAVWVKAGNNSSGDGPGYGERFESYREDCEPPPEQDGGVPDGGDDAGEPDGGDDGGADGGEPDGGCGDSDSDSSCGGCECDDDYCDECDRSELDCCQGGPVGEIAVEFECFEVHITSCKDISNVVLDFGEEDHYKFDDLDGHCLTLGTGDRHIVGVWVKAGNNKSGDGPGYGEHFESDLEVEDCEPPPEPDGGVPDAGEPDSGEPDAGEPDGGEPDAGEPDSGEPDAGVPDGGEGDAGEGDSGIVVQ